MVADGGIDAQPLLSPQRRLLAVDLPVGRVAAVEGHIAGKQQDVRLLFTDFLRQPFAHSWRVSEVLLGSVKRMSP